MQIDTAFLYVKHLQRTTSRLRVVTAFYTKLNTEETATTLYNSYSVLIHLLRLIILNMPTMLGARAKSIL